MTVAVAVAVPRPEVDDDDDAPTGAAATAVVVVVVLVLVLVMRPYFSSSILDFSTWRWYSMLLTSDLPTAPFPVWVLRLLLASFSDRTLVGAIASDWYAMGILKWDVSCCNVRSATT